MKPICVPCQRFYRPKQNGFYFLEGMPTINQAKPGLAEPELWVPYKLWVADLWHCPDCGTELIVGAAPFPIAKHYQPDFSDKVTRYGAAHFMVKDC